MAEEKKEVTTQAIGFSFHVSIEREIRTVTGAKYPDKTLIKASLGGHADTSDQAKTLLNEATKEIKKQLEELAKTEG